MASEAEPVSVKEIVAEITEEVTVVEPTTPLLDSVRLAVSNAVSSSYASLEEIRKQLSEYDKLNNVAEKANSFLIGALEVANSKLADLRTELEKIHLSQIPTVAIVEALAQANIAFQLISDRAKAYDEQYQVQSTVQGSIGAARATASAALSGARAHLEAACDATLAAKDAGVSSTMNTLIRSTGGMVLSAATSVNAKYKVSDRALAAAEATVQAAATLDNTYGITGKAMAAVQDIDAKYKVSSSLSAVDEKYLLVQRATDTAAAVASKASEIDSRITGGAVSAAVVKGVEAATTGALYVQSSFAEAKTQQTNADAPIDAPAAAEVSVPVDAPAAAEVAIDAPAAAEVAVDAPAAAEVAIDAPAAPEEAPAAPEEAPVDAPVDPVDATVADENAPATTE